MIATISKPTKRLSRAGLELEPIGESMWETLLKQRGTKAHPTLLVLFRFVPRREHETPVPSHEDWGFFNIGLAVMESKNLLRKSFG